MKKGEAAKLTKKMKAANTMLTLLAPNPGTFLSNIREKNAHPHPLNLSSITGGIHKPGDSKQH